MNYLRILGVMAVAATALMAFAASASATALTSPTGTTYTSTFAAESEGALSFDGAFTTITCSKSQLEGKAEQHGSGVTVKGNLTKLTFTECNFPFTVLSTGNLEFHAISEVKNAEGKFEVKSCQTVGAVECTGTVTSSGTKLSVATSVGNCVFTTNATDIGTLTPTNDTGSTATLDIGAPEGKTGRIPRTEGNFLCGSSSQWTGSYKFTTPDNLYIDG